MKLRVAARVVPSWLADCATVVAWRQGWPLCDPSSEVGNHDPFLRRCSFMPGSPIRSGILIGWPAAWPSTILCSIAVPARLPPIVATPVRHRRRRRSHAQLRQDQPDSGRHRRYRRVGLINFCAVGSSTDLVAGQEQRLSSAPPLLLSPGLKSRYSVDHDNGLALPINLALLRVTAAAIVGPSASPRH
jgi:hypothetical protein